MTPGVDDESAVPNEAVPADNTSDEVAENATDSQREADVTPDETPEVIAEPLDDATKSEPPDEGRGKHSKSKKPKRKAPWWELPALVVGAIVLAIVVKTFLLQPFFIPSGSMEQTLHGCPGCKGDRILVNKVIYDFTDPRPGDIVVFHDPPGWESEPGVTPPSNPVTKVVRGFGQLIGFVPPDGTVLVKRVIAVGGQTVRGKVVDGKDVVQISESGPNGPWRTLDEPFVYIDPGQTDNHGTFGPVTVPKGRIWVMGDHRNDSADSRFHCEDQTCKNDDGIDSTVPNSDVIGKAFVIVWPPSRWTTLGTPSTFEQ